MLLSQNFLLKLCESKFPQFPHCDIQHFSRKSVANCAKCGCRDFSVTTQIFLEVNFGKLEVLIIAEKFKGL